MTGGRRVFPDRQLECDWCRRSNWVGTVEQRAVTGEFWVTAGLELDFTRQVKAFSTNYRIAASNAVVCVLDFLVVV